MAKDCVEAVDVENTVEESIHGGNSLKEPFKFFKMPEPIDLVELLENECFVSYYIHCHESLKNHV